MKLQQKIIIQRKAIREIVSRIFKLNGQPFPITDGQCDFFEGVTNPKYRWVWMSGPTRYGKTEILALALIYLAVFHKLKIPIVAGTQEKANKIMEYIIAHLSDNPALYRGLLNIQGVKDIERLKVMISKQALRWIDGGWIYITSVDSRTISKEGERVIGEGGDVVVLEEAGLIKKKEQYSKIVRMPERNRGWGKMVMSGNCVEKSIFESAYKNELFYKIRISLEQSIQEGRVTEQELEEKKSQTTSKDWKRFYLVKFPEAGEYAYFKPTRYEYLPRELKYYGSLDPALGETKKGCLTGIVVLGEMNNGQIYEVESIGDHLTPDEAMRRIFSLPYKFERFVIESVQFQKYFLQEIDKKSKELKIYIPFEGIQQSKKKEERIESLEPAINTKQILFKGDNELWNEMQDYPETENVDCLDALEMAWRKITKRDSAGHWTDEMVEKDETEFGDVMNRVF